MDNLNGVIFIVPGEPVGKQRPKFSRRGGFVQTYTPKRTVDYESNIKSEYEKLSNGLKFSDDSVLDLSIKAYYKIPGSANKKKKSDMLSNKILPSRKPDIDNIIKIVSDALNTVAYKDDSSIVSCSCTKVYSNDPRIEVMISVVK